MSGKTKSLDALTGLRFIAALAVFIHHVMGRFGTEKVHLPLGSYAVSFFFVLSGFILTYVYHDRLKLKDVKRFYFTRWARIWPLHFVCLGLVFCVTGIAYIKSRPDFGMQFFAVICLVQSWIPNTDWVFAVNGVSWSISVEMFFYLMFPLFLLGGQRQFWFKYVGLLALMAILLPIINSYSTLESLAHIDFVRIGHCNPLLRLPEFCTGMAVGYLFLNRAQSAAADRPRNFWIDSGWELFAIGSMIGFQYLNQALSIPRLIRFADWGGPFITSWYIFTSGCLVFAILVYVFSKSTGLFARLLSLRPAVFLGEVSFAFYMVHQIVIRATVAQSRFYEGIAPWAVILCVGLIALSISTLLYVLVEMPCKSALLALYDGKFKKAFWTIPKSVHAFSTSSLCVLVLLMFFVPLFTLADHQAKPTVDLSMTEIISETEPQLRDIRFGESLALLGFRAIPKRGGFEVVMVWEKQAATHRGRYIHICDADGKVVGYGPRQDELFDQAKIGSRFVDRVFLVDRAIREGSSIGIGFHRKGQGMALINKGPRSMNKRRLDLISQQHFAELVSTRNEKFGTRVSQSPQAPDKRR